MAKYDWLDYTITPSGPRDWVVTRYGRYIGVITRFVGFTDDRRVHYGPRAYGYSCTPMQHGEPLLPTFNEARDRICQADHDTVPRVA